MADAALAAARATSLPRYLPSNILQLELDMAACRSQEYRSRPEVDHVREALNDAFREDEVLHVAAADDFLAEGIRKAERSARRTRKKAQRDRERRRRQEQDADMPRARGLVAARKHYA